MGGGGVDVTVGPVWGGVDVTLMVSVATGKH